MAPTLRTLTVQLQSRPHESGKDGTEIIWRLGALETYQRLACGGGKLRALRHRLAGAYDLIRGLHGAPRNRDMARENLRHALREAHKIGREFFGGVKEAVALQEWLRLLHGQPLEWQVEAAPSSMFALDLLPLGWLAMSESAYYQYLDSHQDLTTESLASMLPCWQWPVIRRFLEMEQPARHPLPRTDKIRMAFIGDGAPETVRDSLRHGMKRAHQKLKRHRVLAGAYQIEKPWPDHKQEQTDVLVSALAKHLVNPAFMPRGGHYPETPAAITHFYCHGKTILDEAASHSRARTARGMHFELQIGQLHKTDDHHQITAKELRDHIEIHQANEGGDKKKQRTLIFMNACAGGMQAQMDDAALASVFLSKRHPAVIATEAKIDGGTARRISAHFYECLLDTAPAHHALWQARRRMTCETTTKQNPFPAALLYSCYGIPDCRLEGIRDEKVPATQPPESAKNFQDLFFPPSNSMTKS
jgi:hypothetical protein